MAIQTFTAAQVLTAAQMNTLQANDYNQTVSTRTASSTLVAADKGTRVVMNVASANTVTVNTSLFTAGDTLVIQNINAGVTTVTAGTATVSSAGPLTISQYGSGTLYFTSAGVSLWFPSAGPAASSGLTRVGGGTLSGDTTFTNVFSATYRNYFVTINNPSVSSGSSVIVSVQVGGQTSNYSNGQWSGNYTGSWGGLEVGSASTSKWEIGYTSGSGVDELAVMQFVLFNTFEAKRTIIQNNSTSAIATYQMGTGSHSAQTSYSDMKILSGSSTFNGGLVNIYGFSLS